MDSNSKVVTLKFTTSDWLKSMWRLMSKVLTIAVDIKMGLLEATENERKNKWKRDKSMMGTTRWVI